MATNHTENYALNLWEPQDAFLRTEFNENTQKLDTTLAALSQTVAGAMVLGQYQQTPGTQVDISLGFRPRMVVLVRCGRPALGVMLGEYLMFAFNDYNSSISSWLSTFTDDGFYIKADDIVFNKNYNSDPAIVFYAAFR